MQLTMKIQMNFPREIILMQQQVSAPNMSMKEKKKF